MVQKRAPRVVIATGGTWGEDDYRLLHEGDVVIGVDGGVVQLANCGITPNMAVGDFDTAPPQLVSRLRGQGVPVVQLPREKDVTDTDFAVTKALEWQPEEIVFLGAWGSRWDHTLANVNLLEKLLDQGVRGVMENRWNRMFLARPGEVRLPRSRFYYLSLLAWSDKVSGLTLEGFRYPLTEATISRTKSLTVSNEWEAETGIIRHREGLLLIVQSRDPS